MEISDNVAKATSILIRMQNNGVSPMDEEDYRKALIITQELDDYNFHQDLNPISMEEAMYLAGQYMRRYPNIEEELGLLDGIMIFPFIIDDDYEELYYNVAIDPNTFEIERLQISLNTNKQSPIYIAHEIHHMLKDTNKDEYKNKLKYADVLPLFFELLVGEEEKKEIITNRLYMLNLRKEIIEEHLNREKENIFKDIIDSTTSQYYLSFYYAILLLEEYHKDPKKVLDNISRILKHQNTTENYLKENKLMDSDYKELVKEKMKIYSKKNN